MCVGGYVVGVECECGVGGGGVDGSGVGLKESLLGLCWVGCICWLGLMFWF